MCNKARYVWMLHCSLLYRYMQMMWAALGGLDRGHFASAEFALYCRISCTEWASGLLGWQSRYRMLTPPDEEIISLLHGLDLNTRFSSISSNLCNCVISQKYTCTPTERAYLHCSYAHWITVCRRPHRPQLKTPRNQPLEHLFGIIFLRHSPQKIHVLLPIALDDFLRRQCVVHVDECFMLARRSSVLLHFFEIGPRG